MSGFVPRRMAPPFERRRPTVRPFLQAALASAPFAVSATMGIELCVAVAGAALAPKALAGTAVLCAVVSTVAWCTALASRNERAFVAATVLLAGACALAALPVHRTGSAVVAALGGAAVLAFAEIGATALERLGARDHVGRPSLLRALWVAPVAVAGAAVGWLLLALGPELSGFGLAAVAAGVVAAVCLLVLAAVLTGTAVGRSGPD